MTVCACGLSSTSNDKRPLTTNNKEDAKYYYYYYHRPVNHWIGYLSDTIIQSRGLS